MVMAALAIGLRFPNSYPSGPSIIELMKFPGRFLKSKVLQLPGVDHILDRLKIGGERIPEKIMQTIFILVQYLIIPVAIHYMLTCKNDNSNSFKLYLFTLITYSHISFLNLSICYIIE